MKTLWDDVDPENLSQSLLELFKINGTPQFNRSLKPYTQAAWNCRISAALNLRKVNDQMQGIYCR